MKFTFDTLRLSNTNYSRTIYYDGNCNLCSRTIVFIKRYDARKNFDYVPLQYSEFGSAELGTIIYAENNKLYRKSEAVLRILKHLRAPVSWLYFFIVIPRFIRDWLYEIISEHRYKWFGKCETCNATIDRK